MSSLGDIIQDQSGFNIWALAKLFYLSAIILYFLFAVVVVRQIKLMTGTIVSNISQKVKYIGYFNLLLSLLVFALALIIL